MNKDVRLVSPRNCAVYTHTRCDERTRKALADEPERGRSYEAGPALMLAEIEPRRGPTRVKCNDETSAGMHDLSKNC